MENLILCVTYTAKPGMRDAFVHDILAGGVLEKVRGEDGCIAYQYFFSVENEDQILLVEKWTSEEYQKAHLEQPHMSVLRELKERYIADTRLERFS